MLLSSSAIAGDESLADQLNQIDTPVHDRHKITDSSV